MNSKHYNELELIVLSKLTDEEKRIRTDEDGVYIYDILHKTMGKTIDEYNIGFNEFLDALDRAIEDIRKEEEGRELDEDLPF